MTPLLKGASPYHHPERSEGSPVYEHKNKVVKGFTQKYNVDRLLYYEICPDSFVAIEREKQIKGWSRKKKNDLVNTMNPQWQDLYHGLC